jgi:hypothetical protein
MPSLVLAVALSVGVMAGINARVPDGAATLDGAYHLGDLPLWLHGRFAFGEILKAPGEEGGGTFVQLRAGAVTRGCVLDGHACATAGVDLGYEQALYWGVLDSGAPFAGLLGVNVPTTPIIETIDHHAIAVPRVGLDLGGAVRFRPGVELALDKHGINGGDVTLAVAYTW